MTYDPDKLVSATNPLPVDGAGLAPVALGQAAMADSVPVTLASNQPAVPVSLSGASFYNTAANTAGHAVKGAAGVLYGLSVNTAGITSAVSLYNGTADTDPLIGSYSTTAQGGPTLPTCGIEFTTGLFMVATGATPADITVAYR